MNIRLREFGKLRYQRPRTFLVKLRAALENELGSLPQEELNKLLRSNRLKDERELIQAALFCVGLEELRDTEVGLCQIEAQDYDCVVRYMDGDTLTYVAIQLKEVVPNDLNPTATVQGVVDALCKYTDSRDLCVVIYINQNTHFDPSQLKMPPGLAIGGLWIYGETSQDRWALWGDLLTPNPLNATVYSYPK